MYDIQIYSTEQNTSLSEILGVLDDNPSFDMVENVIIQYAELINLSKWLIGDVLVFIKEKANYDTIKVFQWNNTDPWPDEVRSYIKGLFGLRVDQLGESKEFVLWEMYAIKNYRVLYRPGECRIWKLTESRALAADIEFDRYLNVLSARLLKILNDKSLYVYFRTALIFPPSKRSTDRSLTWYYENINLAASQVDGSLNGKERLTAIQGAAVRNSILFEEKGFIGVRDIQRVKQEDNNKRRGFEWTTPDVPEIRITDIETGESTLVISFEDNIPLVVKRDFLYGAGLIRGYYYKNDEITKVIWEDDRLQTRDGVLLGHTHNESNRLVAAALVEIAGRMGWVVKYK